MAAAPLNLTSNLFFLIITLVLLYIAYTIPTHLQHHQTTTSLVFYVHDLHTGSDATATTVAGNSGADSHILHFGSIAVVDDLVTEGLAVDSAVIGRCQGFYVNTQLDGGALQLVLSVVFTAGEYRGSSLEIQGMDRFLVEEKRQLGVVSGTGRFQFVKGFAVMETPFMDLEALRAVMKFDVTLKHY